jgi:uncharacterized protein YlxW (UPF0749 family)
VTDPQEPARGESSGDPGSPAASSAAGRRATGPAGVRTYVPPLLESLGRDSLDPGYAEAAARRAADPQGRRPSRTSQVIAAVAGLLVAGLLFGTAAGATVFNEPRAEKARSALLEDIDRAQTHQSELAASASALADDLRSTQADLGAAGPLQTVAELERASGSTAVRGPGLRIVIDQGNSSDTSGVGVIQDRDIQLLVNDLWAAGAEAISVGGVRLRPTSSIRQAGGSILVDNRPVFWPITIEAIGEPSALQVRTVGSAGFGRFSSFAQLYDIQFDVTAAQDMVLPAGSGPELRYAQGPGIGSGSSGTAGSGSSGTAGSGSSGTAGSGSSGAAAPTTAAPPTGPAGSPPAASGSTSAAPSATATATSTP